MAYSEIKLKHYFALKDKKIERNVLLFLENKINPSMMDGTFEQLELVEHLGG